MAGLLSKLDKRPKRRPPSSEGIKIGAPSPTPPTTSLTQELARDVKGGELPWWMSTPPLRSGKLDSLVPMARAILNEQLTEPYDEEQLHRLIRRAVAGAAGNLEEFTVNAQEQEEAAKELLAFVAGMGPLQPLFDDPLITDIFVDAHDSVSALRNGQMLNTPFRFRSSADYQSFIDQLINLETHTLSKHAPLLEFVLNDRWRSRVSIVHESVLARSEPALAFRIPRLSPVTFYELLRTKTLPTPLAAWLSEALALSELSLLITGAPGTGKTTMAAALLSACPAEERVVTIEPIPEIVSTVHRQETLLMSRELDRQTLLNAALHRRPTRLILGDVQASEATVLMQALQTHLPVVAVAKQASSLECVNQIAQHLPGEANRRALPLLNHLRLVITMGIVSGRPCLLALDELQADNDGQPHFIPIVKFRNEEQGKRIWEKHSGAPIIEELSKRGIILKRASALIEPEAAKPPPVAVAESTNSVLTTASEPQGS